jgi:hypothetical protein
MEIFSWPDAVAQKVGVSAQHLQARRAMGDAPRLFAVTERCLVTTGEALAEWIAAKEVPRDYKCRPPVRVQRRAAP